jgi:hypothetical protein
VFPYAAQRKPFKRFLYGNSFNTALKRGVNEKVGGMLRMNFALGIESRRRHVRPISIGIKNLALSLHPFAALRRNARQTQKWKLGNNMSSELL